MDLNRSIFFSGLSVVVRKAVILGKFSLCLRYDSEFWESLGEFGKLLGVSAQAVSKWEREECYPDITFLPEIAALLCCSISDLFDA